MGKKENRREDLADDKQKKLKDWAEAVPGDNKNQNHNAKKEALGPNTQR